jgi:hypothetical protein
MDDRRAKTILLEQVYPIVVTMRKGLKDIDTKYNITRTEDHLHIPVSDKVHYGVYLTNSHNLNKNLCLAIQKNVFHGNRYDRSQFQRFYFDNLEYNYQNDIAQTIVDHTKSQSLDTETFTGNHLIWHCLNRILDNLNDGHFQS